MTRRPSRRGVVSALLLLLVVAATAGGLQRLRIDTSFESFLPSGDPTMRALQDKARSFGGDPILVLLESRQPRQLLLDQQQLPRLLSLEGRLSQLPDVAAVYGPATVLNQVAISAQNLLAQISGRRDGVRAAAEQRARQKGASKAEAAKAGRDAVAGFDRRYGSLLLGGLPAGLPTLHNSGFVQAVIYDQAGNPRPQWHFIVPSTDAVAILVRPRSDLGAAGVQRLVSAVGTAARGAGLSTRKVTVSGAPAVTAALATQVRRELPLVGGVAVGAIALCFLLAPRLGPRRSRLWPLACTLTGTALTLAAVGWSGHPLSLGVVAFLPILLGIGSDFPLYLAGRRRRVLAAATASAAGFAALAVSPLPFVRELGLALAVGLLVTVATGLVLRRRLGALRPAEASVASASVASASVAQVSVAQVSVVRAGPRPPVRSRRMALLALACVLAAVGWAALPRINVEADPERLASGLPALDRAQGVQRVLGSSGEVSVVLRGDDVLSPQALDWSRRAETAVLSRYGDRLRPIVTAPDLLRFLGTTPSPEQIAAAVQVLPDYLVSTVVRPDRTASMMAFGIELQDLHAQRRLLDDVRSALPPPPHGLRAEVVGLPVAAVRGYDLVSAGRYAANLLGIAAAGVVLAAGLGRRSDAGRAVLAAALATGWVLAGTWALGWSLSPLSVALGSLTTATACEYVVLLAGSPAGGWQRRSVAVACLSATLGYLALSVSALSFLRQFGLLLAASVVVSYAAARVVTYLLPPRRDHGATGLRVPHPREATKEEATV